MIEPGGMLAIVKVHILNALGLVIFSSKIFGWWPIIINKALVGR
jgi:hypothetical protein